MSAGIRGQGTNGKATKRGDVLRFTGLWLALWVISGLSVQAEILYDEEGIQLHGTVRIATENAATCHVLERSHTETQYEALKANDGQPLHVWRLDYSAHNRTGKALDDLRADFHIQSAWPPCTNWSGEGPGGGPTGSERYSGPVTWADSHKTLSAPYGMDPDEVMQGEVYVILFHTDRPSFERWSTNFTFRDPDRPSQRPGPPSGTPAPSRGSSESASIGPLPAEVMLDKYLLEAEMLSEEKDHKGALEAMDRLVALQREHGLTLPEEFPFQYAKTALAAVSYQAAIDSVNRYLSEAGRDGEHYREALALLVKSERGLREPALARAAVDSVAPDSVGGAAAGPDVRGSQRRPQVRERLPFEPEMVEIPRGSFRMGCVSGRDCDDDEFPVHTVQVARFELSKYEVTFEEYDPFTAATGRVRPDDAGWGRGRRPVINVSWDDAVAYTQWLSQQTGERYRLPSEAEWEYAGRAGTETKYHYGNDESRLCDYGNYADTNTDYEWRNTACSDGVGTKTAIAGSYRPNTWGLHDMHGNVWEWVQDCWNGSYRGAPSDGSAWEGGDCSRRVLRGGSWINPPRKVRSAIRNGFGHTSARTHASGFRVARTITR